MAKAWYIVRVQAEREEKIRESLLARIRAAGPGVESRFGRIVVPSEHLQEIRGGKRRITQQKMYPGYMMVEMKLDDDTWFLITETPGISGFVATNRTKPEPLPQEEVDAILREMEEKRERPRPKVQFELGERVKIKEGAFQNYDGVVEEVDPGKGQVKVSVSIFGRSTMVEFEYSKVEKV